MKKFLIYLFVFIVIFGFIIFAKKNNKETNNNDNIKVKVAEVAHSVFYAPQYVAISKGFFEDEGIDIDLTLANGADNVMSAVLSGDVDIGFCGTEATIYVYNSGEKDYPMTFAGLTKRDGSFLVSREKIDNFSLKDLKGKYIIGGRKGGMPEMTLEWTLKENGIDPNKDVTIDTSVAFAAMGGAFIHGTGDYVSLFEPNATQVEKQGFGFVVAYLGELGGEVPYTAYNARRSYIKNNPEIIKGFSNAIDKGLKFVKEKDSETIANSIIDFFPDTSLNDLITIVDRYKNGDAWRDNITINPTEWNHIQDIVISAGELDSYVSYDDLIYTKYFKDYE